MKTKPSFILLAGKPENPPLENKIHVDNGDERRKASKQKSLQNVRFDESLFFNKMSK